MPRVRADIVVLGGGPAGCTAAMLLARWGYAVRLVTRPASADAPALAESLTPSCGKFFDLLGIREAVDAAGFVSSTGHTVWWGEAPLPRVEPFAAGERGWQVTAPALEAVMRAAAVEAGARVEARTLTAVEAADLPGEVRLDCTGRSGLLARTHAGRVLEPGHRTVALTAVWRAPVWTVPDPSHTLIESYADGWAWSVPLDPSRRAVAVMVDPRTSALVRGEGAATTYRAELGKTRAFARLLANATCETAAPAGWDASMYHSTTYTGDGWLVAGDAASFVDPLSSAGVKKALASGWLAAIVTHTSLRTPSMAAAARAFFADREREMYAGFLALTRQYLAAGAGESRRPFWAERAEMEDAEATATRRTRERAAIEAAYARIRSAPTLAVRPGAGVRIEPRPAIAGHEIVLERRIVTTADPAGVHYLSDVDVVTLVELAPTMGQVPTLYDACVARAGPTDLGAFLMVLATAVARGWLEFVPGMSQDERRNP